MKFSIELRPGDLRVMSSVAVNIASGLLVAPFTTSDPLVLTTSFLLAILLLAFAVKVERFLDVL